jgi:type IV pilus assembly protein PilB
LNAFVNSLLVDEDPQAKQASADSRSLGQQALRQPVAQQGMGNGSANTGSAQWGGQAGRAVPGRQLQDTQAPGTQLHGQLNGQAASQPNAATVNTPVSMGQSALGPSAGGLMGAAAQRQTQQQSQNFDSYSQAQPQIQAQPRSASLGTAAAPARSIDAEMLSAVATLTPERPDGNEADSGSDSDGPNDSDDSDRGDDSQLSDDPDRTPAMRLAERLRVPYVNLEEYHIDSIAVQLVPEQLCRHNTLVPIGRMDSRLMVAMADPSDVVAIDDVSTNTGLNVVPMAAEPEAIIATIDRYHRVDSELEELSNSIASSTQQSGQVAGLPDEDMVDSDDDAPIIRFVNLLISQAIMDHASDIHIEPRRDGLAVRYRIDGVLHEVQHASRTMIAGVISRLKIMAGMDIAERRKPQDGRVSVNQAGRSVDLRVATLPTVWGEKVVMRILDSAGSRMTIDDLNMSEYNLHVFRSSFNKPHGMVLVTGPTGSGKSTTLYSVVAEVAKPEVNVITVEDPVEFRMDGVNQVQVNVKAGLTFASALRSILRSDPDIVLIGEIRDRETAQIAIEASLTGHLVLSTLHTNDAPSAVMRLVEMGVEPFLVGSALECVVAQRLARRLCPYCREEYIPDSNEIDRMRFPLAPGEEPPTFWHAVGCQKCSNTGYSGRIAIHEVMQVDTDIERLAVADASASDIQTSALRQGMITLRDDGWAKAAKGLTTVDEVLRVTA